MGTPALSKIRLHILVIAAFACGPSVFAQNQNPIQAAKDAYKETKQANQPSSQSQAHDTPTSSNTSASAPSDDCCSPEAMKKIASSLDYLDVVGIKLGMTPQQAIAAIKAHNANLKIDVIHTRLEHPTATPGTFERVPLWIWAHSLPQKDYSSETIGLVFTAPPNPPLLAKVARYVLFPNGQPVLKTTLVDALDKKYGPENTSDGQLRLWVYDTARKPVSRFLTAAEKMCNPGNFTWDFPGGDIRGVDPSRDESLNLSGVNMDENQLPYERHAACVPLTFVAATLDAQTQAPNSPVLDMMVVLLSPALLRDSRQATHDWLQAELDGKRKKQENDTAKRAAPKI
jgi:hypothetical protein